MAESMALDWFFSQKNSHNFCNKSILVTLILAVWNTLQYFIQECIWSTVPFFCPKARCFLKFRTVKILWKMNRKPNQCQLSHRKHAWQVIFTRLAADSCLWSQYLEVYICPREKDCLSSGEQERMRLKQKCWNPRWKTGYDSWSVRYRFPQTYLSMKIETCIYKLE